MQWDEYICLAQKPVIYRPSAFIRDRLGFDDETQIIFRAIYENSTYRRAEKHSLLVSVP